MCSALCCIQTQHTRTHTHLDGAVIVTARCYCWYCCVTYSFTFGRPLPPLLSSDQLLILLLHALSPSIVCALSLPQSLSNSLSVTISFPSNGVLMLWISTPILLHINTGFMNNSMFNKSVIFIMEVHVIWIYKRCERGLWSWCTSTCARARTSDTQYYTLQLT